MALCIAIEVSASGPPSAASATGKTLLPWIVGDAAYSAGSYSCPTGSHVLLTVAEAGQTPTHPLLALSPAEGAQISGAILLIWGVGWGFRVLVQTLRNTDGNLPSESE